MAKDRAARKAARAAKRAAPAEAGARGSEAKGKRAGQQDQKKKKNPLVKQMRRNYAEQLKKEGVPEDQIEQKVSAQMKDVLVPAMKQAKQAAKAKNLKGAERRKFIQQAMRGKVGETA